MFRYLHQRLAHRVRGALQHPKAEEAAPWGCGLRVSSSQQGDHPIAVHSAVPFAIEGVASTGLSLGARPAQGPGYQQGRAVALAVPCCAVFIICKIGLGAQVSPTKGENAPAAGAWPHGHPAGATGEAKMILRNRRNGK